MRPLEMNNQFTTSTKVILGAFLILLNSSFALANEAWFEAARTGDQIVMEKLLSESPNLLNQSDKKGYTALILASYHDHREATLKLLKKGADPCLTDLKGNTALMGVLFKGHKQLMHDLADKCDINHRNKEGQTALMFASLFGREEMVKIFLALGAEADLKDHEGRTAVSLAEGQWNQAMVSLLKTFKVIKQ